MWLFFLSDYSPSPLSLSFLDLFGSVNVSLVWLKVEISKASSPYVFKSGSWKSSWCSSEGSALLNQMRHQSLLQHSPWEEMCAGVRFHWCCYSLDSLEDFIKTFSFWFRKRWCALCSLLSIWNVEIMQRPESWLPLAQKLSFMFFSLFCRSGY